MDELRVAAYAVACAAPALTFERAHPDDPRPAAAIDAARAFAEGHPGSRLNAPPPPTPTGPPRRRRPSPPATPRPLPVMQPRRPTCTPATATQVRHILGAAAHAACAAELARGDDPVVAEYVVTAAKCATPSLEVLTRYPRAPQGRLGSRP